MRLSTDQCSQENFVFPKLKSYNIAENEDLQDSKGLSLRTLRIRDFWSSLNAFKELFCNVEKLSLRNIGEEHKNIVRNVDRWGLNELTSLQLTNCDDLERLIDTTQEESPTIAFSNLVNLDMRGMICLKELCHGQSPINFLKKLEILSVEDCEQLPTVFQSQTRQISNLRTLKLELLPTLENIWKESTHHVSLQSLKDVIVDRCNELKSIFSPCLVPSLLHLEQLQISACKKLEQVFAFDKEKTELEENQLLPLSNLSSLHLELLPEMKWIWKGSSHFVSLQNLKHVEINCCSKLEYLFSPSLGKSLMLMEELKIRGCGKLQHIITELDCEDTIKPSTHLHSLFLPRLRHITIRDCPGLKYIFQIPLAENVLPRLEFFWIDGCSQLQQLFKVAKENNGVGRVIALPRLQYLRLQELINLHCFYPENFQIGLPSLEKLSVWACPKLKDFTTQTEVVQQAPLKILYLSHFGNAEGSDPINFFVNIFETQAGHFFSRIEYLHLQQLYQLQGPIQVVSLQCLKSLNVSKCQRLKFLLSPLLARSLPQLTNLEIEYCEGLEGIIEMDQISSSSLQSHLQPISFPGLEYVTVYECNNLRSLFPISVTCSLSKLKEISIWGASKLERVFGYEGKVHIEDDRKGIKLPALNSLKLQQLPRLKSFALMGYHFRFPYLVSIGVLGCPKLITSLSIDSKRVVHAITEALRVAQQDTIEGSAIAQDIVWFKRGLIELPPYQEQFSDDCRGFCKGMFKHKLSRLRLSSKSR